MLSLAHLTEIDKDILIRSWNLVSSSHYWSVFKECVLHHFRKAMKAERVAYTHLTLNIVELLRLSYEFTTKKVSPEAQGLGGRKFLMRVLRFVIARMKTGLEANVQIRKANRKEVISGLMNDHDCHCWQQPRRRSISQMTQDLRQTEHSSVVPEYFLRMTTLEMEVEDPKHKFSS
ncbi:unnamed protein product [Nippostrongylus brasiliensis]|uniref:Ras-GEF domain-containing protein n=1 Tax=Nippostrongylus brasiliensis TaxID=27835 RepID=A0A0N4YLI6_NIPBR|nr:unnamed protein product [Nippostrongylus brasiliensis]